MLRAITGLAVISGISVAGYGFRDDIASVLGIEGEPIRARITLQNKCDISDRAFVVRDLQTGAYAGFRGGRAVLNTVEHHRLRIEIAPRFSGIDMTSQSAPAKERMTLTAACSGKAWSGDSFTKD